MAGLNFRQSLEAVSSDNADRISSTNSPFRSASSIFDPPEEQSRTPRSSHSNPRLDRPSRHQKLYHDLLESQLSPKTVHKGSKKKFSHSMQSDERSSLFHPYDNSPYSKNDRSIVSLFSRARLRIQENQLRQYRQGFFGSDASHNCENVLDFEGQHYISNNENRDPYDTSAMPVDFLSEMQAAPTPPRKINKTPVKVLDAPDLEDDFYLNLVDWSSTNILSVGLGASVYLWSASTSKVSKLCDAGFNMITSVSWSPEGKHLAVGFKNGNVEIWDTAENRCHRKILGHRDRVTAMSWNGPILSSGCKDNCILNSDLRQSSNFISRWLGHTQEVCGLRWSPNAKQLASGGNDNKLLIWQLGLNYPVRVFNEHHAAVKALAWSPHHNNLLVSGGGTADRCIRFWNTVTGKLLQKIDTGSQVCNVAWSKTSFELVSTHGYSLNQVIIWRYPIMQKIATLTGHTFRVLYLAISPDGQTIVTGAGDETLRFWSIFPSADRDSASAKHEMQFSKMLTIR